MESLKKILIAILVVAVLFGGGVIWYFYNNLGAEQAQSEPVSVEKMSEIEYAQRTEEVQEFRMNAISENPNEYRDFIEEQKQRSATLEADKQKYIQDELKLVMVMSLGLSGSDTNLNEAKEIIQTVSNDETAAPILRARAILSLANLVYMNSFDSNYAQKIFTGQFAKYATSSVLESIKLLSLDAIEYHPYPRPMVNVALYDMIKSTDTKVTKVEKDTLVAEAQKYLKMGEEGESTFIYSGVSSPEVAWYLHWKAVSYGYLASIQPDKRAVADKAFADVIVYTEPFAHQFGHVINDVVPYVYVQQIAYLTRIDQKKNKQDIDDAVVKLLSYMKDDNRNKPGMFARFIKKQAELKRNGMPVDKDIALIQKISPEFNKLVSIQGASR